MKNWNIPAEKIYVEAGASGSIDFNESPEGERLVSALKSGDRNARSNLVKMIGNVRHAFNTLHELGEQGVSVHFLELGGEVTCNSIGAIVFAVMSASTSFERERIATRIREVKQVQKMLGKFCGGRRAFGYQIVDGRKERREDEQQIISKMKLLRSAGNSYRSIASWLASNADVKMTPMGVRWVLQQESVGAC